MISPLVAAGAPQNLPSELIVVPMSMIVNKSVAGSKTPTLSLL